MNKQITFDGFDLLEDEEITEETVAELSDGKGDDE